MKNFVRWWIAIATVIGGLVALVFGGVLLVRFLSEKFGVFGETVGCAFILITTFATLMTLLEADI